MSKRRKGNRKRGKKRTSAYSNYNITKLQSHQRKGSKLKPPLNLLPGMAVSSWADDHMPEMLWAALLAHVLDRKSYLNRFRSIAIECREWFLAETSSGNQQQPDGAINFTLIVDHTMLSEVSQDKFDRFATLALSPPLGYAALRPLLLIESLPDVERWRSVIDVEPTDDDWNTIAGAIAGALDHQSERSTDIRWFKLILAMISGRMHHPTSMVDRLEEVRVYPDKGDMRSVRPFIRAGEMSVRRNPPSAWVKELWAELLSKTRCIDPTDDGDEKVNEPQIDVKQIYRTRFEVIERFLENISAERADARLDSSFGLVLFGLGIAAEIARHHLQHQVVGRLALRAIVESNITLRYLEKNDTESKWKTYRVYGAGQAKLAFLKAQQIEGELPPFIDEDSLYQIANEDVWQEFLDIDVGHWTRSNLRKLAIECGAKELYDRYYDWASAFIHGQWGAVRDSNFVTCHNPMHRLHRIPRLDHRRLNSVEVDVAMLVNEMLGFLDTLYPGKKEFSRLKLHSAEPRGEPN